MKSLLLAAASALAVGIASPVLAQDHAGHGAQAPAPAPAPTPAPAPSAEDHSAHEGRSPAPSPSAPGQGQMMDHSQMDHSRMDHSQMPMMQHGAQGPEGGAHEEAGHGTVVGEKLVVLDVLEPPEHRVPLGDVPARLGQPGGQRRAGTVPAGYAYTLPLGPFGLSLGGSVAGFLKPDALEAVYGDDPIGYTLFAKLTLGR